MRFIACALSLLCVDFISIVGFIFMCRLYFNCRVYIYVWALSLSVPTKSTHENPFARRTLAPPRVFTQTPPVLLLGVFASFGASPPSPWWGVRDVYA